MSDNPKTPDQIDREISLREREVRAREREVNIKEREHYSGWRSPVVVAIAAATIAIVGNIYNSSVNSDNTAKLERLRAQSNIVLEALKTNNDKQAACNNLAFYLYLKLLDDADNAIKNVCRAAGVDISHGTSTIPALPTSGTPNPAPRTLTFAYTLDNVSVEGVTAIITYSNHFTAQCTTNKQGKCSFGDLRLASDVVGDVEIRFKTGVVWHPVIKDFPVPYSGQYLIQDDDAEG